MVSRSRKKRENKRTQPRTTDGSLAHYDARRSAESLQRKQEREGNLVKRAPSSDDLTGAACGGRARWALGGRKYGERSGRSIGFKMNEMGRIESLGTEPRRLGMKVRA